MTDHRTRIITITLPERLNAAGYVATVAEQIAEGYNSGHVAVDHHWSQETRHDKDAEALENLRDAVAVIRDAWSNGDLAGAVNDAVSLLPDDYNPQEG